MPKYEEELRDKLSRGRAPVTVGQYIRRLQTLNDGKHITSLKYLSDVPAILERIDGMNLAFSTKTSYLTAICATLKLYPRYTKAYNQYLERMLSNIKDIKEDLASNTKNDKQHESIISLEEVLTIRNEHHKKALDGPMTYKRWENLVAYLVLSLYTMIPPRRNKDFSHMVFVLEEPEVLDPELNYYVLADNQFVFNNYKTKEQYGKQVVSIPDDLQTVMALYIDAYLRHIPIPPNEEPPLLVHYNGQRINMVNGITRILNRAFGGRHIASSALRHITITDKYADTLKEQKELATAMAHSVSTQKDYIRS